MCTISEMLRSNLHEDMTKGKQADELKHQKRNHLDFIEEQKKAYYRNICLARHSSPEYLSIFIYGADQNKYNLPHLTTPVKDPRCHGIGVHVLELLQHRSLNRFRL